MNTCFANMASESDEASLVRSEISPDHLLNVHGVWHRHEPYQLKLTSSSLCYRPEITSDDRWSAVGVEAIIGAQVEETRFGDRTAPCRLVVYAYVLHIRGCLPSAYVRANPCSPTLAHTLMNRGQGERELKRLRFDFRLDTAEHSASECCSWRNAISRLALGQELVSDAQRTSILAPVRRKYLCIVNPVSGAGIAQGIMQRTVLPMLRQADIEYDLLVTERAGHATDHVRIMNLEEYACIVVCGGDGLVSEVLNGLTQRENHDIALQRMPLAIIPGGSGNGLAKSVLFESGENFSTVNATFLAIKGKPDRMDLALYTLADGKKMFSFLSLAWGLTGDTDILTEPYRWMGEARFTFGAIYFIAKRRTYRGRLSMLMEDDEGSLHSEPSPELKLDEKWMVIEDDMIFVWVVQTPYSTSSMHSGPGVRLADGLFHIMVVRGNVGRMALVSMLISMDSGEHVNHPAIELYTTRAYRLEPLTTEGLYSIDGEVVTYGPLQAQILPYGAQVLIRHPT